MKGCFFITKKESLPGFSLVGYIQVEADEENLVEVFAGLMNSSAHGLVFIDERLLSDENVNRLQHLERQWGGAIISLPSPGMKREKAGMDFARRFISRVLGYEMKLS